MAKIIHSLYGLSGGSVAHVPEEGRKLSPPLTDLDPPASIVFEVNPLAVGASLNHVRPNAVRLCFLPHTKLSVRRGHRSDLFEIQAAAGFGVSGRQRASDNAQCFTANALTEKKTVPTTARVSFESIEGDYFKPSKCLTDGRYSFGHTIGYFNFVSSGGVRLQPALLRKV
jgi:hypothetical protein